MKKQHYLATIWKTLVKKQQQLHIKSGIQLAEGAYVLSSNERSLKEEDWLQMQAWQFCFSKRFSVFWK